MAEITYEIVEHDGGFAYKVGDVFSEAFPTHADAVTAANQASQRQERPGTTEAIQYQDAAGAWHEELAEADDRPHTAIDDEVDDNAPPPHHSQNRQVIGTTEVPLVHHNRGAVDPRSSPVADSSKHEKR